MWQKQQQVGNHMTCVPFVNLVEWKISKPSKWICWTKITITYKSRNVYQTKDIQPWSESLPEKSKFESSAMVEKRDNCALAHCSSKNTAEKLWSPCDTDVVPKLFAIRTLSAFPCCALLNCWHFELDGGADCWPVSVSGTENILASDSSSESPRPPWWFFFTGKDPDRLRFSSNEGLNSWRGFSRGPNQLLA